MKKKQAKATVKKEKKISPPDPSEVLVNALELSAEISDIRDILEGLGDQANELGERVQDIEIHVNLLTRLLTTLCIEKFGVRVGVLKRLIKRIEQEAIRDSQISHLESLYNLSSPPGKKKKKPKDEKNHKNDDPWEDIS